MLVHEHVDEQRRREEIRKQELCAAGLVAVGFVLIVGGISKLPAFTIIPGLLIYVVGFLWLWVLDGERTATAQEWDTQG
jgi:hypothetical protein